MRRSRILSRFIYMLLSFVLLDVILVSFGIYRQQVASNNEKARESIRNVTKQIEYEILADEDDFEEFVEYLIEYADDIYVPVEYESWDAAKEAFDVAFANEYPGLTFGTDISFSDLPEYLKNAYTIYNYEYYDLLFRNYESAFNLPYVYFITPTGNGDECAYVIDVEVVERDDDPNYRIVAMVSEESREVNKVMWEVWEDGEKIEKWDSFDNEYGRTYSYYLPLYIKGEKVGLICADVYRDQVNEEIIYSTLKISMISFVGLLISVLLLSIVFRKRILSRITYLQNAIQKYSETKDAKVAEEIDQNIKQNDEISDLYKHSSDMIRQIDEHINNVSKMSSELNLEKIKAETLKELANTDSLTGLYSRTAYYDVECEIDEKINNNQIDDLGIILIDLNDLKLINDNYGHDKGDIALINISEMIKKVFGLEHSYRLGGDEFAVIMLDTSDIEKRVAEFKNLMETNTATEPWVNVKAALGYEVYKHQKDCRLSLLLIEADKKMYKNKEMMKQKNKA